MSGSDVIVDARDLDRAWSRGDWGVLATRSPRAVVFALEDATPAGHDHVHGEGDHARTMLALRDVLDAGLRTIVTSTLTRSSARSIGALARELTRLRVTGWCVSLTRPDDATSAAAVVPSLGVTMPHVLRGAELASRGGVATFLSGFPRCVLGPYARWEITRSTIARGAPCDACHAREGCAGLTTIHRARFGSRELRTLDAKPELERSSPRDLLRDALLALGFASDAKTSAD